MSPIYRALQLLPDWFRQWVQFKVVPALGMETTTLFSGLTRGIFDSFLLLLLGAGLLFGSDFVMRDQYSLPPRIQETVVTWAPIADLIAREAKIPREVPLVLWFKENSMLAENPASCTGIIGAYDLVRSGQLPCFTPGPLTDLEIRDQLALAAAEFKARCPDIDYYTQEPEHIKRCYFAYNAGMTAAARLNADESAYVMNNYDEDHTNMVYSDIELGTVEVTALGAWPAHLAMQSLIIGQIDEEQRPFSIALLDLSTHLYDVSGQTIARLFNIKSGSGALMDMPQSRDVSANCIDSARSYGKSYLRPSLNPVGASPILTQDLHGCSYSLPGLDISSNDRSALLVAPLPGTVTTFTDKWGNSTIRIENEEWIGWLLHARTYLVDEGEVISGESIGIMGAVGYATGPHVHYTLYDKIEETFVDPGEFLPWN